MEHRSVRQRLHENLLLHKLCAKFVPKMLTIEQKERRRSTCQRIETEGRDWMKSIITGDESWVFQYDSGTRRQSRQWVEAGGERPKKTRMLPSQMKTMVICFFDIKALFIKSSFHKAKLLSRLLRSGVATSVCQGCACEIRTTQV